MLNFLKAHIFSHIMILKYLSILFISTHILYAISISIVYSSNYHFFPSLVVTCMIQPCPVIFINSHTCRRLLNPFKENMSLVTFNKHLTPLLSVPVSLTTLCLGVLLVKNLCTAWSEQGFCNPTLFLHPPQRFEEDICHTCLVLFCETPVNYSRFSCHFRAMF